MSLKAAQQFFYEVAHNPRLQDQVDSAELDQVIKLAAREGYMFTLEELQYLMSKWHGNGLMPNQGSHIRQ